MKKIDLIKWSLMIAVLLGIILTAYSLYKLTIAMFGIHSRNIEDVIGFAKHIPELKPEAAIKMYTDMIVRHDKIIAIRNTIIGFTFIITPIIFRVFFFNDKGTSSDAKVK